MSSPPAGAPDDGPRVALMTNRLDDHDIARLRRAVEACGAMLDLIPEAASEDDRRRIIRAATAVVGWPDPEHLTAAPLLRFAQLLSADITAYRRPGVARPGLVVANARGLMDVPVAEHTLALMLTLARRLPAVGTDEPGTHWRPRFDQRELADTTACIVGYGSLGRAIGQRARAFGMHVIGLTRTAHDVEDGYAELHTIDRLHEMLPRADHVVVALPGGPETANAVGEPEFALMRQGACFYNIGRGSCVDQRALIDALTSGRLAGAGLDVFDTEPLPDDDPLWELPNVVLTPHVAGRSDREIPRRVALIEENLVRFLTGREVVNAVDIG